MSVYDSPFFNQGFAKEPLLSFNGGNDFLRNPSKNIPFTIAELGKSQINGKWWNFDGERKIRACNTTRRGESCALKGKHVWYLPENHSHESIKFTCLLSCKIQRGLQVPIASSKILIQMQTQIYETHLFFFWCWSQTALLSCRSYINLAKW